VDSGSGRHNEPEIEPKDEPKDEPKVKPEAEATDEQEELVFEA